MGGEAAVEASELDGAPDAHVVHEVGGNKTFLHGQQGLLSAC